MASEDGMTEVLSQLETMRKLTIQQIDTAIANHDGPGREIPVFPSVLLTVKSLLEMQAKLIANYEKIHTEILSNADALFQKL